MFAHVMFTVLFTAAVMMLPIVRSSRASERSRILWLLQRGDLAIIVNKANPVDNLSLAELRQYFLAERSHWTTRQKIRVAMREPGSAERDAVLRLVCGMSRDQDFVTYFLHAKFTEQVTEEPRSLDSTQNMIRFVANVAGAIGYVPADEVDPSVRVIRVDGLTPGDPGYKLKY